MSTKNKNLRSISEHLLAELKNGKLNFMVRWATDHKDRLVLCFRGNGEQEEVILYDRSHIFLKGFLKDGVPYIAVSINHIKPEGKLSIEDKKNNFLEKFNFEDNEDKKDYPQKCLQQISEQYLSDLFSNLEIIMDYFFKYSAEIVEPTKLRRNYIEKKRQQEIFKKNNENLNTGYFIYDMESTAAPNSQANKDADKINNRTDMMALKFDHGHPVAISMIEVKSEEDACRDQDTGINAHLTKMCRMLSTDSVFVQERIQEAYEVISQYRELGLYDVPQNERPKTLPVEVALYLTDDARAYWKNPRRKMDFNTPDGWIFEEHDEDNLLRVIYTPI